MQAAAGQLRSLFVPTTRGLHPGPAALGPVDLLRREALARRATSHEPTVLVQLQRQLRWLVWLRWKLRLQWQEHGWQRRNDLLWLRDKINRHAVERLIDEPRGEHLQPAVRAHTDLRGVQLHGHPLHRPESPAVARPQPLWNLGNPRRQSRAVWTSPVPTPG